MKIAFLTTSNNPINLFYVDAIYKKRINQIYLIYDTKKESKVDLENWKIRTKNFFKDKSKKLTVKYFNKIKIYKKYNHNSKKTLDLLVKKNFNYIVNIGSPRKFNQSLIKFAGDRLINIHPGILPKYRGCNCVEWAILNNDPVGNTIHVISKKYDTGPILLQKSIKINNIRKYYILRIKVFEEGIKLLVQFLLKSKKRKLKKFKQDNSKAKFWKVMDIKNLKKVEKKINTA